MKVCRLWKGMVINIFRYRNMDIKLGGREMAIIPKAVLKEIRVEDIPDNFEITLFWTHGEGIVV
jgi:hypothetical protein